MKAAFIERHGGPEVLQFGEAMVRKQALGPIPALWVPCAIFAACSLWLFWVADRKPGQDPLAYLFDGLSTIGTWFRRLLPRRLPKPVE